MYPFPNPIKVFLFQIVTSHTLVISAHYKVFLSPQKGPVRKKDFCEGTNAIEFNTSYFQINFFLTIYIWYPLFRKISTSFTKIEGTMKQLGLLPLETLPPRINYDLLFKHLPSLALSESDRGRPPLSRDALLKAFIYKALRRLKPLTDLTFEFHNNPMSCQAVGFNPYRTPLP